MRCRHRGIHGLVGGHRSATEHTRAAARIPGSSHDGGERGLVGDDSRV
ncbi:Hypothetical protein A7982_03808 [Minicystis rosea]|nr:Hypothetical protein A7982_03808 [Minicystis rosea]